MKRPNVLLISNAFPLHLGYRMRLLAIPMYFCVVNVVRGEQKVVWETARN